MATAYSIVRQLLLLWVLVASANGQTECTELQAGDLGSTTALSNSGLLTSTIGATAGEASNPNIQILEINTVCLAQGAVRGRYRSTSVVVRYMRENVGEVVAQVEYQCSNGMWGFGSSPTVDTSLTATLTTPLRTDCIICIHPDLAFTVAVTDTEHCAGKITFSHR